MHFMFSIKHRMSVCIKRGHFCIIEENATETPEQFAYRCYAITSGKPTTQSEYDRLVNLSNHLVNIKFLGCSYSKEINDTCAHMDNDIFSN